MIITGWSRSGTSLLLALLYCTVKNKKVEISAESDRGVNNDGWISKNPASLTEKPGIKKPVIMVRDPRAVLTSMWFDEGYFVGGDFCKNGKDHGLIKNYKVMRGQYSDINIFRYEHLILRPDQFQDHLGQYWGLDYIDEFSTWPRFPEEKMQNVKSVWRRKMNGVREIDSGHDWRDHMPRIREQFDYFPELHDMVIGLGYESDRHWYDEVLAKTEPQTYTPPTRRRAVVRPKPLKLKLTRQQ